MGDFRREFLPVVRKSINLGDAIKAFRISEGVTQEELAEKLGVSERLVYMIEINKVIPPLLMLKEIAEVLGYDEEIFQGDDIILPVIREEGIPSRYIKELLCYLEERRE